MLSITDTLSFFNIDNGVLRVDSDSIELLPSRFATFLGDMDQLYLFEKNDNHDNYTYFDLKKKNVINFHDLKKRWNEIVLLVEKPEVENIKNHKKLNMVFLLSIVCGVLFSTILFLLRTELNTYLFFVFPIIGVLFSIAALKDLFGAKSEIINSFCNFSSSSSCSTVIDSKKWKIFEYLNLSEISLVFFVFQFVVFSISIILKTTIEFFLMQKILLVLAMPLILLSVYYQKNVEKKWCPICLTIGSILVLELIFSNIFFSLENKLSVSYILIFSLTFFLTLFVWNLIKPLLLKIKELKEFQLKGIRFMRNYQVFKSTLVSKTRVELPESNIVIGSKESKTEITIITSPFCGHCKTAHHILEKIYKAHHQDVKLKIIINTNIDDEIEERRNFYRTLMSIYLEKGENEFMDSLDYWFENKDIDKWMKKYQMNFNVEKIDYLYRISNIWCEKNKFTFTPAIFINGFLYPKTHYREDLEFFINEIIEDEL